MSRPRSRLFPALLTGAGLVVAVIIAQSLSLLPKFSNPVKETEVDRSGPPLLLSLEDQADQQGNAGQRRNARSGPEKRSQV